MTNNDKYVSPDIEVVMISVELGFANSLEDPTENDEIEW